MKAHEIHRFGDAAFREEISLQVLHIQQSRIHRKQFLNIIQCMCAKARRRRALRIDSSTIQKVYQTGIEKSKHWDTTRHMTVDLRSCAQMVLFGGRVHES
jgi:ribosomal protein L31E